MSMPSSDTVSVPALSLRSHKRIANQLQTALRAVERVQQAVETVPALGSSDVHSKLLEAVLGIRGSQNALDRRFALDCPTRKSSYWTTASTRRRK